MTNFGRNVFIERYNLLLDKGSINPLEVSVLHRLNRDRFFSCRIDGMSRNRLLVYCDAYLQLLNGIIDVQQMRVKSFVTAPLTWESVAEWIESGIVGGAAFELLAHSYNRLRSQRHRKDEFRLLGKCLVTLRRFPFCRIAEFRGIAHLSPEEKRRLLRKLGAQHKNRGRLRCCWYLPYVVTKVS